MSSKNKIIAIVGPTSSGKTSLGVALAAEFNGEIVSADSRQVYRGMDIGTGKDLGEYEIESRIKNQELRIKKIPYHLIDVAEPNEEFSLADFQKLAYAAIDDILKRGKLPIIVGGSGLYMQAIIDGYQLPDAKPNRELREKLEKETAKQLYDDLKEINPVFAGKLNNSDKNNKRRLIRYLEIAGDKKQKPKLLAPSAKKYNSLILGLTRGKEELHKRIYKRLIERLEKEDMIGEVDRLHNQGVSWQRLEKFGLEYKFIAWHLQEKIDYDEMVDKLFLAIKQFSKRQLTWFKRWEKQGAKINWFENEIKTEKIIKDFIKK